jgi:hypothetical protein
VIRWLRDHPGKAPGISAEARNHTLRNHTYLHRVRTMLTDLNYTKLIEKTDDAIGLMIKEAGLVPG